MKKTIIKSSFKFEFYDQKEENIVFGRCVFESEGNRVQKIAIRKYPVEGNSGNSKEISRDLAVLKTLDPHENLIRYIACAEQSKVL